MMYEGLGLGFETIQTTAEGANPQDPGPVYIQPLDPGGRERGGIIRTVCERGDLIAIIFMKSSPGAKPKVAI